MRRRPLVQQLGMMQMALQKNGKGLTLHLVLSMVMLAPQGLSSHLHPDWRMAILIMKATDHFLAFSAISKQRDNGI